MLFDLSDELEFKLNNYIFKEGDPSDNLYFIKEGTISITRNKRLNNESS